MLYFQCLFLMLIFDVDFQCFFSFFFSIIFFFKIFFVPKLFFIILFLLFNLSTNVFLLYIFNTILFFLPFFSILIAHSFRFFPFFILFSSKTCIFYYDNVGPP